MQYKDNGQTTERVDQFAIFNVSINNQPPEPFHTVAPHQRLNVPNQHHILFNLLPPQTIASQKYNLRRRTHDKQLPKHTGHLTDSNFIIRMLYTDIY